MKVDGLICPYSKCGRSFEQPVMVTDYSKLPRETFYACPHCMLRLELLLESRSGDGFGRVRVQAVDGVGGECSCGADVGRVGEGVSSAVASRPSKTCRHFLGYLQCLPEGVEIPDECAVCGNVVQCFVRRKK